MHYLLCTDGTYTTPSFQLENPLPYTPYPGCVLEHILQSNHLTNNEKLFYLLADSLSIINHNYAKERSVALASNTWAKKLNCSKSEIFAIQKSLEEKGYFAIIRDTNQFGKNKRNIIIPTLPDNVFHELCKSPDKFNANEQERGGLASSHFISLLPAVEKNSPLYINTQASKKVYLDKTKLFIKLNYQLLKLILTNKNLSSFAKVVWLDFYSKSYKYYVKSRSSPHSPKLDNNNFAFTTTYRELEEQYSCSRYTLSRTISLLENLSLIARKRRYVKNHNESDNLHDRSIWTISLNLPEGYQQETAGLKSGAPILPKEDVAKSDPYCAEPIPLLNKDLKTNIKNIDIQDREKKIIPALGKNLSLSEFYQNEEENHRGNQQSNNSQTNKFESRRTDTAPINNTIDEPKTLKSFYPLSIEQVDKLNSLSDREFSVNFANQLLLKLYCRDSNKTFLSVNHMMSYMSKAFRYELHQAPKVNHESFRFAENLNSEEKELKVIEKYLTEVENNQDISQNSQFQKKLANIFEPQLAYKILTTIQVDYKPSHQDPIDANIVTVTLLNNIALTKRHYKILEDNIIFVYGYVSIHYKKKEITTCFLTEKEDNNLLPIDTSTIWGKIRLKLKEEHGEEIDKAWFSHLTGKEDTNNNVFNLHASSSFIRDWVKNKYDHQIRQYMQECKPKLKYTEYHVLPPGCFNLAT